MPTLAFRLKRKATNLIFPNRYPAFPEKDVITRRELYPDSGTNPLRDMTLPAARYGDLRPDQYYAAFGYLHVPSLIPDDAIEGLVSEYKKTITPYPKPLLRQSGRYEMNELDAAGSILNPFLQPHLSGDVEPALQDFGERVLDVACHPRLHAALASLTPYPNHILTQTMMFEQAVTPPHQDWVYLDTLPSGHLTAAWIALEDIAPEAARFFVIPGSQNFRNFFDEATVKSTAYMSEMGRIYREKFEQRMMVPTMKRGDVLFWNSRLVHGSIPGTVETRTRLSLAVHTIPRGFRFGNVYREKGLDILGKRGDMFYA